MVQPIQTSQLCTLQYRGSSTEMNQTQECYNQEVTCSKQKLMKHILALKRFKLQYGRVSCLCTVSVLVQMKLIGNGSGHVLQNTSHTTAVTALHSVHCKRR